MKKILVLILALVMVMSLTACGGNENVGNDSGAGDVDIATLNGTWRGAEHNWEMYFVFDGNGNMMWYTKNMDNGSTSFEGTYKYEYKEDYKRAKYWSTDEEGAFCPVEVVESNGGIQYKMMNLICEEVEDFVPSI